MTLNDAVANERLLESLNSRIVACRLCPRLVAWREQVAGDKRRAFREWEYWGKPVPIFGDPQATRLMVGLAPAAHGANRTGRMFTGDRSGDWLYRALHKVGAANQSTSADAGDGLRLNNALICACAHCAPPDNKPLPQEFDSCSRFLVEMLSSRQWRSILCLGGLAWNHVLKLTGEPRAPFGHAASLRSSSGTLVVASYHPSQQNTFTGKLTEEMFDRAIALWASA